MRMNIVNKTSTVCLPDYLPRGSSKYFPEFSQELNDILVHDVEERCVNDVSRIRQIGCLPVKERRYFHLLNLVHKALYSPNWPTYVQLVKVQHKRTLRSSQATRLQIPLEKGTFQDATATHFKALPANLGLNIHHHHPFKKHSLFSFKKQNACLKVGLGQVWIYDARKDPKTMLQVVTVIITVIVYHTQEKLIRQMILIQEDKNIPSQVRT
ncbi:hypothetical protein P5673_014074 [Acropora cervicornis]|uniref:Uncharacterized protein n=1 Tax=Acropora cervicornis TaxID=6130 RepID=A0AAD9QJK5_ACRCE|nr:hypothetical protein P5673_014074 [Acropora cervicornis]